MSDSNTYRSDQVLLAENEKLNKLCELQDKLIKLLKKQIKDQEERDEQRDESIENLLIDKCNLLNELEENISNRISLLKQLKSLQKALLVGGFDINGFFKEFVKPMELRDYTINALNDRLSTLTEDRSETIKSYQEWLNPQANDQQPQSVEEEYEPPRNAGKHWTQAEESRLKSLYNTGSNVTKISKILGRSKGSIISRLNTLFYYDWKTDDTYEDEYGHRVLKDTIK